MNIAQVFKDIVVFILDLISNIVCEVNEFEEIFIYKIQGLEKRLEYLNHQLQFIGHNEKYTDGKIVCI